jgi:hypothetical protein
VNHDEKFLPEKYSLISYHKTEKIAIGYLKKKKKCDKILELTPESLPSKGDCPDFSQRRPCHVLIPHRK